VSEAAVEEVDTRARLLAATTEVVAERGVSGARVADIARRAGLTTGAIYSNYRTKDELVAAAMAAQHERLFHDALDVGRTPSGTLVDVLVEILRTEARDAHRALLDALATAARDPEVSVRMRGRLERRSAEVVALVEEGVHSGVLAAGVDADALAYVLHLVGLGNVVAQAIGTEPPPSDALGRTLSLLIAGLTPPGG
jgi:AcrR family transcriptional regulator